MLRKLALRLAFLSAEDRDWLLSQLPDAGKKRITSLIDEANEMGLTKDPLILSGVSQPQINPVENKSQLSTDELGDLPLFWQHLVQAHQSDTSGKNLPESLMLSVIAHARNSLANKMEDK
jgi:hypothetical protein